MRIVRKKKGKGIVFLFFDKSDCFFSKQVSCPTFFVNQFSVLVEGWFSSIRMFININAAGQKTAKIIKTVLIRTKGGITMAEMPFADT